MKDQDLRSGATGEAAQGFRSSFSAKSSGEHAEVAVKSAKSQPCPSDYDIGIAFWAEIERTGFYGIPGNVLGFSTEL